MDITIIKNKRIVIEEWTETRLIFNEVTEVKCSSSYSFNDLKSFHNILDFYKAVRKDNTVKCINL